MAYPQYSVPYQPYMGAVPDQLTQYKQQYQQTQYPPYSQQGQQPVNGNDQLWVASEAQAEAYLVAPNGFVRLWDSNKPCFYEKRCDPTGKPLPMIIYDYNIRGTTPQQEVHPQSATVNTSVDYESRFNDLEKRIAALEASKPKMNNNNNREDNRK